MFEAVTNSVPWFSLSCATTALNPSLRTSLVLVMTPEAFVQTTGPFLNASAVRFVMPGLFAAGVALPSALVAKPVVGLHAGFDPPAVPNGLAFVSVVGGGEPDPGPRPAVNPSGVLSL